MISLKKLEKELESILTDDYCGTALGYDHDTHEFIIYSWGDAPVSSNILARGKNLTELMENYHTV